MNDACNPSQEILIMGLTIIIIIVTEKLKFKMTILKIRVKLP